LDWNLLVATRAAIICLHLAHRRIFVYNISLISIGNTVSDKVTKSLVVKIEREQHKKLS